MWLLVSFGHGLYKESSQCSSNKRSKCNHEMSFPSFHILRVFLCENELQKQFLVVLIRCGTSDIKYILYTALIQEHIQYRQRYPVHCPRNNRQLMCSCSLTEHIHDLCWCNSSSKQFLAIVVFSLVNVKYAWSATAIFGSDKYVDVFSSGELCVMLFSGLAGVLCLLRW